MKKKVYACSGIFIACLKGDEEYTLQCEDILSAAEEGSIELHTSYMAVVEVIARQRELLRRTVDDQKKITEFMDQEYVMKSALEIVVAELSRYITWDFQIKPADAVHIATAVNRKCEVFYTTDKKLVHHSNAINDRIRLPRISVPEFIRNPTLPLVHRPSTFLENLD